jgi:hypothetical protein
MAAVISGVQVECTFSIKPNFNKSLIQYFTNIAICSVKAFGCNQYPMIIMKRVSLLARVGLIVSYSD